MPGTQLFDAVSKTFTDTLSNPILIVGLMVTNWLGNMAGKALEKALPGTAAVRVAVVDGILDVWKFSAMTNLATVTSLTK